MFGKIPCQGNQFYGIGDHSPASHLNEILHLQVHDRTVIVTREPEIGAEPAHVLSPGGGIANFGGGSRVDIDAVENGEQAIAGIDRSSVGTAELPIDLGQPRISHRHAILSCKPDELCSEPLVVPWIVDHQELPQVRHEVGHETASGRRETKGRGEIDRFAGHVRFTFFTGASLVQQQTRTPIEQSMLTGLLAGAATIFVLKLVTGLAFLPLLVVFVLVFATAGIFRLRLIRMSGSEPSRRR